MAEQLPTSVSRGVQAHRGAELPARRRWNASHLAPIFLEAHLHAAESCQRRVRWEPRCSLTREIFVNISCGKKACTTLFILLNHLGHQQISPTTNESSSFPQMEEPACVLLHSLSCGSSHPRCCTLRSCLHAVQRAMSHLVSVSVFFSRLIQIFTS